MVKNNVYYEWFASITVPNPDQVGYWVDLGADSKGRIIKVYNRDIEKWIVLFDVSKDDYVPPFIGSNGNWWVDNRDTGVKATAEAPYIGENDHWFTYDPINKVYVDTGIEARGLSAYDIAVKLGFEGSEQDWIDSLSKASEDAAVAALDAANKANEAADKADQAVEEIEGIVDDAIAATDKAEEIASNPPKIVDGDWWIYDYETKQYVNTGIAAIGDAFTYKKEYPSVEAMEADWGTADVKLGEYVLINTNNVEDPDDAKVYLKTQEGWKFIVDLSGMQGIQGWSAYEVAVKHGFVGTEEEWVQSLKQPALDAAAEALDAKAQVEATEKAVKEAEALRVTAEQGRVNAENTRVSNENTRISNEDSRKAEETKRVTAENERIAAENSRRSEEDIRKTNEANRISAESSRASAETLRASAEAERNTNEQKRIEEETKRISSEEGRVAAETERVDNEDARIAAETARDTAEQERESNEATRQANEAIRETQEAAREKNTADAITAVNEAKTAAQQATTNATTAANNANTQANRAKEYADNPPKVGDDGYWYLWDEVDDVYVNTGWPSSGIILKGSLDSPEDLDTIVDPQLSDSYIVGTDLYFWNGTEWVNMGRFQGPAGEKGEKGEKGDPFVYSDFTSEQLESLKGPQGEPGQDGQDGKDGAPGAAGKDATINGVNTLTITAGDNISITQDGSNLTITGDVPPVDLSNYLAKDNATEYTPTGDYNPATKKYVDNVDAKVATNTAAIANKANAADVYTKSETFTKTEINEALSAKVNSELVGAVDGIAQLDATGKVPASQLPSYVDDVLEYDSKSNFPIDGESGKIYVAKDTNLTYRWSGTDYIAISSDLALGETSSTAYPGDKGKANADKLLTIEEGAQVNDIEVISQRNADLPIVNKKVILKEDIAISDTEPTGDELIWINTAEDYTFNFDGYTQQEADNKFATKQEIPTTLPANGGNADTVNGYTVLIDVPADAKFTDTVYDDSTITLELAKKIDTTVADGKYALKTEIPELITVDAELSGTSENAIQNKAVYAGLTEKVEEAPVDDKQYARKNKTWVEVESMPMGETVKITVTSNQAQPDASIIGATITVVYGDNTKTLSWEGAELSTDVPVNMSYTITCSTIEGYSTPETQTYIALAGNTRNVSLSYNTTITTINVTSNQSAEDFVTAANVNLTGGITKSLTGALTYTVNIPTGIGYTVAGASVDTTDKWYTIPANQSITATGVTQTVTLQYTGCKLNISVVATEGSITPAITVKKSGGADQGTWNIASDTTKSIILPHSSTQKYDITGATVTNYDPPTAITGVAVNTVSVDKTITYTFLSEEVYACWVIFDESNPTTVLEKGGSDAIRQAIRSKFRRCMVKPQANGKAAIAYLGEQNSALWADGSSASATVFGAHSGEYIMVHFPKYYYRCETLTADKYKLYISDRKLNDNYQEERECLIGAFEGYAGDSGLASHYNVTSSSSLTITSFYTAAQANGSKWGLIDYRAHKTIANMFAIMYGNTNISTQNPNIPCSGGNKGHSGGKTGGTLSLGNQDGVAPTNGYSDTNSSSFLGIEDCYYSKWEFVQGVNIRSDSKVRVVYDGGCFPDKFDSALTSAGATNVREISTGLSSLGWITKIVHGIHADVMPSAVGGSDTTYYADYNYVGTSGSYTFMRSGSSYDGSRCGVFVAHASNASSVSWTNIGSRLGFYGEIEVKTPTEWMALLPVYTG